MKQNNFEQSTGLDFFWLAMTAFAGLGLEVVLAFFLEPLLYGSQMAEWTTLQCILHWSFTCILWGLVSAYLIRSAKKQYGFDLGIKGKKTQLWQWVLIILLAAISLIVSYIDWNGLKVVMEFYANGWLKFIFQYIYYFFETILVMLILIFGQIAFEKWFRKQNIPYGGIILALTWGIAHFFTKDFMTGIVCMISGLAFGSVYLLVNRDAKKAFWVLFVMFVL